MGFVLWDPVLHMVYNSSARIPDFLGFIVEGQWYGLDMLHPVDGSSPRVRGGPTTTGTAACQSRSRLRATQ